MCILYTKSFYFKNLKRMRKTSGNMLTLTMVHKFNIEINLDKLILYSLQEQMLLL